MKDHAQGSPPSSSPMDIFQLLHTLFVSQETHKKEQLIRSLYEKPNHDIERVLPQLCQLYMVWKPTDSTSLHQFLSHKATESLHLALKISFLLDASSAYCTSQQRNRLEALSRSCEMSYVNQTLTLSIDVPKHLIHVSPQRLRSKYSKREEKTKRKRRDVARSNPASLSTSNNTHSLDIHTHATPQSSFTPSTADAHIPTFVPSTGVAKCRVETSTLKSPPAPQATPETTGKILSSTRSDNTERNNIVSDTTDDGTINTRNYTDADKNNLHPSGILPVPPISSSLILSPPALAAPMNVTGQQKGLFLAKEVRSLHFDLQLKMIQTLNRISETLVKTPRPHRKKQLISLLRKCKHTFQSLYFPSIDYRSQHYVILNIVEQESIALSSRDKAPFMMFIEITHTDRRCGSSTLYREFEKRLDTEKMENMRNKLSGSLSTLQSTRNVTYKGLSPSSEAQSTSISQQSLSQIPLPQSSSTSVPLLLSPTSQNIVASVLEAQHGVDNISFGYGLDKQLKQIATQSRNQVIKLVSHVSTAPGIPTTTLTHSSFPSSTTSSPPAVAKCMTMPTLHQSQQSSLLPLPTLPPAPVCCAESRVGVHTSTDQPGTDLKVTGPLTQTLPSEVGETETALSSSSPPLSSSSLSSSSSPIDALSSSAALLSPPLSESLLEETKPASIEVPSSSGARSRFLLQRTVSMPADLKKCNTEILNAFGEPWRDRKERLRKLSPSGNNQRWNLISCIFKGGDDCRQELLAMQMIKLFDSLFRKAKLPLRLHPYEVLVTSADSGIIETVPDSVSIDSLKKNTPGFTTLAEFFTKFFGPKDSVAFTKAQRNFTESMAANSLIQYFLQIKDRHNGNILLLRSGDVAHIDFGFFLSNSPGGNFNFESCPFKLTQEYVEVMDGEDSDSFNYFKMLIIRGFLEVRKNAHKIMCLVEVMSRESNMACFQKGEQALMDLKARFCLEKTEAQCVEHAMNMVDISINNWRSVQYDSYQRICNGVE